MNATTALSLVCATVAASGQVMQKSASATPAQMEILQAGWPQEGEQLSKRAALSRILATGAVVAEADAPEGEGSAEEAA